jgi:glutamate dehydrogenase/leucine dehydrogenase
VEATGYGAAHVTALAWCNDGRDIDGARIAIQGFGNVGRHAALRLQDMGACVVAVSDERGGVYNDDGLDVAALVDAQDNGDDAALADLIDGKPIDNADLLTKDVDILIPAAIENVVTEENAGSVRAKMIVEAANLPVTCDADRTRCETPASSSCRICW